MATQFPTARGIRNNNPGNIRIGDAWRGLKPAAECSDKSFCEFQSPEYGIRAIVVILKNYAKKTGTPNIGGKYIDTVSEIIYRWAPPNENNTLAYIHAVAAEVGVLPDSPIDVGDPAILKGLVKGIIKHENGSQPYSDEQIATAIAMAK